MKKLMSICAVFAAAVVLSGCGHRSGWLGGDWVFDSERTRENMAREAESKQPSGFIQGVKDVLKGIVSPAVIAKMEGSEITVTDKEFIMKDRDGNGKAYAYDVLETDNAGLVTLKLNNGDVDTFHREGNDEFWMAPTRDFRIAAYFHRVKK